jgi:integrase/recombinase XerD
MFGFIFTYVETKHSEPKAKRMAKQAKVLDEAEFKRVLAAAGATRLRSRNKLLVQMSHWAGARACELAGLRVGDVQEADGSIVDVVTLQGWQTKGANRARMFLSQRLRKAIGEYLAARPVLASQPDHPLFFSQKGEGLTTQAIINLFAKLYADAGIKGASSHSGRRTFITNMAERGVNPRIIQVLARHSCLSTTMRYMDVNDTKLRNAVELA